MLLALFFIVVLLLSFYALAVICEEFFVASLDKISERLKLSSDVAGATLMAVGSSAPELFTSLFALIKPGDHANVGAGTIVGSAIFNILVIIGAAAAFKTVKLTWQPVVRDTLFYVVTIIALLVTFWDGTITMTEAAALVVLYGIYIFAVTQWKKWFPYKDVDPLDIIQDEVQKNKVAVVSKRVLSIVIPDPEKYPHRYVLTFVMSVVAIAVFSYVLVESAVGLGEVLHINPTIIALTVLAAGTSVPDLLSSIIVAKQGRGDMAVSNAIGSNIFDILFGLGAPWLLILAIRGGSISVQTENLLGSIFLLFATVVAIFFILVVRKWKIGQRSGLVLIALYLLYLVYSIVQTL